MSGDEAAERHVFLSTAPASAGERRLALAVVVVSALAFAAMAPFAKMQLARVDAFIPIYQSALTILDIVTAVLLFAQFRLLRSRAVLVLAAAYVFTALMTIVHTLSFPGLFAAGTLPGAGPQTTAWIYMFWHAGFPLLVIAYALLKDRNGVPSGTPAVTYIMGATATVLIVVLGLAQLTTAGSSLLPPIMSGNNYTPAMVFVVSSVWVFSVAALAVLLLRRPHSVLDIWLMVVMCAWMFDIALAAVLNQGRFDLGFYGGRIYGLLAASFVLVVLLLESGTLYVRLARSLDAVGRERERRLKEVQSVLFHVSRMSGLGQMVPALAHEVTQPLTAVLLYLDEAIEALQHGSPGKAETMMRKANEAAERSRQIVGRLRDFVGGKDRPRQEDEDLQEILDEAVALGVVGARHLDIRLEVRADPRVGMVVVDRIQIQQVLVNLIRNAAEAMEKVPARTLSVASRLLPGGRVELSVADTGPGLAPEVRAKLFQPFVTTKENGMGVGLSICRSIVEAHGGTLEAADNPGGGTVFRFTLPVSRNPVRQQAEARARA